MSQLSNAEIERIDEITESVNSIKKVMKHGKWLADTYLYNLNSIDTNRMSKEQLEDWIKYSIESLSNLSKYLDANTKDLSEPTT